MRRLSFALVIAAGLLMGCGGSGSGPAVNSLDLATLAGSYQGTYTETVGGNDQGTATFSIAESGALQGQVVSTVDNVTVPVSGTITSSGAFSGQATPPESTAQSLTGTVTQTDENDCRIDVSASNGSIIVLELHRVVVL